MKKTIAALVTVASVAGSLTTTPAHAQRGGPLPLLLWPKLLRALRRPSACAGFRLLRTL